MRRLYLRIYLAVLASLAVFALVAGLLWRQFADAGPAGQAFALAATLAQNILPPADARASEQQAALEKLAANLRADATLYAADRTRLAAVGEALPAPRPGRVRGGWVRRINGPPAWALPLPDGRWLVARLHAERAHPALGFFATLALIVLAIGVGAFPVVRQLTRRLERLQAGVESLGAGELSARVPVEGSDEVARLAASFNRAAGRIEELVGAHKALLASNKRLFAFASHELRTPLARIRMAVELIKKDADPKRRTELEQDIAELDALIEEILLVSKLGSAKGLESVEEVDLLALAAEECARYEGTELEGTPVTLRGDPRLLRRMLRNLLENARRHGTPPVEVSVRRFETGAEIVVRDHGEGIPEPDRERVFEPFFRRAGPTGGTGAGLGLALVRQIAERHGGTVRCAPPADGAGSRFSVCLGSLPGRNS